MSNRERGAASRVMPEAAGWRARRDAWLIERLDARLSACGAGGLAVTLPSGAGGVVGGGGRAEAALRLNDYRILPRALARGALGFAECYIDGSIDCDDVAGLFRYFIRHEAALRAAGQGLFGVRLPDRLAHRRRDNSRAGSRRNIAAHYDLGNDFYALWLDEGLTYSSGIYRAADIGLEAAQEEKYRAAIAALEASAGMRVLEIGCGWGGMAERLAARGLDVTAITVSAAQFDHARKRLAAAERVHVQLQDYRDTRGAFDRIVSIEMIEAVGEAHWPVYFDTIADRLESGGSAVIQAITIDERWFPAYRAAPDFIQRYIFPGGMLPTRQLIAAHAARAGLACEIIERFGLSYARTLADWRVRFEAAWPAIAALGFDERFRRMWLYYLHYCEVGFDTGSTDVGLYRLRKA